jgi:hypothetical protein
LFFVPVLIVFQGVANNQRVVLSNIPIFYGQLTPGNEPTPPSPSYDSYRNNPPPVPLPPLPSPDSFRVMFGDDSGIYIDGPVNNTFLLKGMPFLTIRTTSDGTVVLNTEVVDSTGNKIVKIVDNKFQASQLYAFLPRQPDHHSLVVDDWDGVEVLNIKYINSKTIWISGRFFLPQISEYVTISPSGLIELGNLELRNVYSTGNSAGISIGLGG